MEDEDWEKAKKVREVCRSGFLSSSGQRVDWVGANTGGGQFPVTRGLKGHRGWQLGVQATLLVLGADASLQWSEGERLVGEVRLSSQYC